MLSVTLEEAIKLIKDNVKRISDTEIIDIEEALGRIISKDFYAPLYTPPFDRSPLDGFAIRGEDTLGANKNKISLKVKDIVYAGHVTDEVLKEKEAVRIMTGGKMPEGSNAVIRLEDVVEKGDIIEVNKEIKAYENYIYKGEDIQKGDLLIEKDTKLNAVHLALLASMGTGKVSVYRQARVGILSTGDEVVHYNEELPDGKIYGTNEILLKSRLREMGLNPIEYRSKEDDVEVVSKAILESSKELDLLITTGGVSVGDKDIFHEVLDNINAERIFKKAKVKPGGVLMLNKINDTFLFNLSGNPFASFATFELFVRALIYEMTGDSNFKTIKVKGIMEDEFGKKSGVVRMIRCIYKDGKVKFPEGGHASGMLKSLANCNALLTTEIGNKGLKVGDQVDVYLL